MLLCRRPGQWFELYSLRIHMCQSRDVLPASNSSSSIAKLLEEHHYHRRIKHLGTWSTKGASRADGLWLV